MLLFASVLSVAIAEEAAETEVSDVLVSEMAPTAEIIAKPTPRQTLNRSMWTLNTWAITNIATGIPLSLTVEDPKQAAFYQMNAGWNAINLSLATLALSKDTPVDAAQWSRIFWLNAGLDVGYVAAGMFMAHKGRENNNSQLEGWGNSIALQGGFLVGFDAVMGWRMGMFAQ